MKGTLVLLAGLLVLDGCAVIDALSMDPPLLKCDGIPTCGQCISNPGCSWCGTHGDKARCMKVTDGLSKRVAACGAEQPWTWELGTCPVLPKVETTGDELLEATPEEDEGTGEFEEEYGDAYEHIRRGLKNTYGNHLHQVSDRMVDGVVRSLHARYSHPKLPKLKSVPSRHIPRGSSDDGKTYYVVTPVHSRVALSEGCEQFQQPVPMARYRLPETGQENISTSLGKAYAGDRKFNNMKDLRDRVSKSLGYSPARADVIAGIRDWGRFAPVTLYLGYRNENDKAPSFYVVEAGIATGQSRTLYLAKDFDKNQVQAQSMYDPTQFANNAHWYNARLVMAGDDPQMVTIFSGETKDIDKAYVKITLTYVKQYQAPKNIVAYDYLLDASMRLAAIGEAVGLTRKNNTFGILQGPLAYLGRTELNWYAKPRKECQRPHK